MIDVAPVMFIMRGLPGSGKSTLAKEVAAKHNAVICSADDYFMENGVYKYDSTKLHMAHSYCQTLASSTLRKGDNVVIDNTNVRERELNVYFNISKETDAFVVILQPETPWAFDVDECFKRNTHGVPRDVIQRMKDNWYVTRNHL